MFETEYKVMIGDCIDTLKTLADGSVHCVVTSPPYFGLRDYGTAEWKGGDPNCSHKVGRSTRGGLTHKQNTNVGSFGDEAIKTGDACPLCGAIRIDEQIGLEEMPEDYIENMVNVFREIKRVLRDDGIAWLNLGDTYAGGGGATGHGEHTKNLGRTTSSYGATATSGRPIPIGLKPKDLIGIPWRVAFALQADGWYLRQDIVWNKPNPMPESVTDRCTKAHEYLFLLTKSRTYYYDHVAIKEPLAESSYGRERRGVSNNHKWLDGAMGQTRHSMSQPRDADPSRSVNGTRNKRSVWTVTTRSFKGAHFAVFPPALIEPCILAGTSGHGCCADCGTQYVREIEKPDMDKRPIRSSDSKHEQKKHISDNWEGTPKSAGSAYQKWRNENPDRTIGWRPNCECNGKLVKKEVIIPASMTPDEVSKTTWGTNLDGEYEGEATKEYEGTGAENASDVKKRIIENRTKDRKKVITVYESELEREKHPIAPSVVLDPFGGSGTTAGVAIKYGRRAILCELNPDYAELIPERIAKIVGVENAEHKQTFHEWFR